MENSLQSSFLNISEIVRSLENQHKVITTLMENATVAMFMMNEKGYCTYMNPAAEKMVGYTLAEMGEKPLHYLIHHHRPDGSPYPMEECPIDKALPTNNSVRAHQDLFFRKDGSTFPVSCAASPIFENGTPVATVVEVKDLTEEKKAERALRESEEKFRFMADSMPQMFWTTRPDGYCDYYNQKWTEYTGIPLDQLYGLGWLETIHPDDRPKTEAAWTTAVQTLGKYQAEYRVRRHDGKYRWHLTRGLPRLNSKGEVIMWVGSTTDIHEQKLLVEELVSSNEELALLSEREQQAYEQVESQRQMLHDLFMNAPAAICIQRGPEHVYELVNPQYQRIDAKRQFMDRPVREAWPELEGQGFFEMLDSVYQTGVPVVGNEARVGIDRLGNGNLEETYFNFVYQPFYEEGKIAGVVTFAFEVTDLVKARNIANEAKIQDNL